MNSSDERDSRDVTRHAPTCCRGEVIDEVSCRVVKEHLNPRSRPRAIVHDRSNVRRARRRGIQTHIESSVRRPGVLCIGDRSPVATIPPGRTPAQVIRPAAPAARAVVNARAHVETLAGRGVAARDRREREKREQEEKASPEHAGECARRSARCQARRVRRTSACATTSRQLRGSPRRRVAGYTRAAVGTHRFVHVRLLAALSLVALAAPSLAAAQTRVVVLPWGTSDDASSAARADEVRAQVSGSFVALSAAETRARFVELGSSDPPVVTDSEVDHWLELSREAVHQLAREDYAGARASLQQAQALSDRAAAELNREQERARQVLDTCLFGVRAFVETNDPGAEDAAMACRRLVPSTEPTPRIHTPEVVELLGRVDRALTGGRGGSLTIESAPSACAVRMNGVVVGQTPYSASDLARGTYRVQVECAGQGRGRVHRVEVGTTAASLRVDTRLDAATRSEPIVRLVYPSGADADLHRAADAAAVARVVGVDEAWLVGSERIERIDASSEGVVASIEASIADAVATLGQSAPGATSVDPIASTSSSGATAPASGDVDPAAWVLVGTGAAAVIGGVVMIAIGAGDYDATANPRSDEQVYARALSRQTTAEVLVGAGSAAAGVGLALGVAGLAWALSAPSHTETSVAVRVTPSGLIVWGSF